MPDPPTYPPESFDQPVMGGPSRPSLPQSALYPGGLHSLLPSGTTASEKEVLHKCLELLVLHFLPLLQNISGGFGPGPGGG